MKVYLIDESEFDDSDVNILYWDFKYLCRPTCLSHELCLVVSIVGVTRYLLNLKIRSKT